MQMFSMSQIAVELFNENPGAFGKVIYVTLRGESVK